MKVSKDVLQTRAYESALLTYYQKFLSYLESYIKKAPGSDFSESAGNTFTLTCAKCVGTLLTSVPHFNFRPNLISVLVPLMNVNSKKLSDYANQVFETLFEDLNNEEASLEATKKISNYIKAKKFRVKPDIIRTFLQLPLTEELPEGTNLLKLTPKHKKKHLSQKQKKQRKVAIARYIEYQEEKAEKDKEKTQRSANRNSKDSLFDLLQSFKKCCLF